MRKNSNKTKESNDFYIEDGKYVFTEEFHLKRGFCCGSKCRHCCFWPVHVKGSTSLQPQYQIQIED